MNIFILDRDPTLAAKQQCDKHVVKMILESAQMLSTVHHFTNSSIKDRLYKPTHKNHPCTKWVGESTSNYQWLYRHFIALCQEYTRRYGKTHLTEQKMGNLLSTIPDLPTGELTDFKLAMPDEYKSDCPVESYRQYYISKQHNFNMTWKNLKVPEWFYYE